MLFRAAALCRCLRRAVADAFIQMAAIMFFVSAVRGGDFT
jgi:hypothetical protein